MNAETIIALVFIFICGIGWGQWLAERNLRQEQEANAKGRINISMPMNPDVSKEVLGLLQEFIRQVELADQEKQIKNNLERGQE